MKRWVARALLCALVIGLVGCAYLFDAEPGWGVVLESDFSESPEWLEESEWWSVEGGVLHILPDENSLTLVRLPIEQETAAFDLYIEFELVEAETSGWGIGLDLESAHGDHTLWIYQNGRHGDQYILYGPDSVISTAPIADLRVTEPNTVRITVRPKSISLEVNERREAYVSDLDVTCEDVFVCVFQCAIDIDYLRVEAPL